VGSYPALRRSELNAGERLDVPVRHDLNARIARPALSCHDAVHDEQSRYGLKEPTQSELESRQGEGRA